MPGLLVSVDVNVGDLIDEGQRLCAIEAMKMENVIYAEMDKEGEERTENWNHWTDASSYANEYYGETFRNTTRYDNDWD